MRGNMAAVKTFQHSFSSSSYFGMVQAGFLCSILVIRDLVREPEVSGVGTIGTRTINFRVSDQPPSMPQNIEWKPLLSQSVNILLVFCKPIDDGLQMCRFRRVVISFCSGQAAPTAILLLASLVSNFIQLAMEEERLIMCHA